MEFWNKYSWTNLLVLALIFVTVDRIQSDDSMCPQDMVYGCKRICYSNCDNLNSTSEGCIEICKLGCDCKEGFVFQSKNSNTCVHPSSCKVSCPENMTFKPCNRFYRETCSDRNLNQVPSEVCMPRCVCNDGYILSDALHCIKVNQCP
uniref:TIL domain-containing protein n=1 Tax=Xenopus laevis TaxID=8355 RepID=B7ZRA4_XENLA|nr:Unknown (protein for MGC:196824) [Xenopus laevis]AAI70099.1 Unknown (protein for MGC:196826) [Xenopus laevis]